MFNLPENIENILKTRNTCEAHYCNVIYPRITALLADLASRHLSGEKIIMTDGCNFTKKIKAEVAEVLESCKAPYFRLFINPKTFGEGTFRQTYLDVSCDYTIETITYKLKHGSFNNGSVRYVPCHIPMIYLAPESLKNYADIQPPVFKEITLDGVIRAQRRLDAVKSKIAALEETASSCKHILGEVGL